MCAQKLQQTGVLVLSGIQGSGKTLTAIHIMNSKDYNGWTKLKFTSCEDLLAFDIREKTVIIIDNIFDGYLYSYPLQRWWHSLCYFYFENVRKQNDIRLIITAKTDVIEKASAHLKANFQLFHVKTESFPLTYEEKLSILTKPYRPCRRRERYTEAVFINKFKRMHKKSYWSYWFPTLCIPICI